MIRPTERELQERLVTKTLDQALLTQLREQFDYSAFESRAVLATVKDIYLCQLRTPSTLQPGQMVVLAIQADEPPGKPLKDCQFVPIVVTVHTPEDDQLRQGAGRQGVLRARRAQIERMAWEAVAQETYLTVEDLAYRILNCGTRTIEDDLAELRRQDKEIPLRGQQLDIGRGISHKVSIVRKLIRRKTYTDIHREEHHAYRSIQRYLEDFVAVAVMTTADLSVFEISFLRRISPALVREYQVLYDEYNTDAYRERLAELIAQYRAADPAPEAEKGGATP